MFKQPLQQQARRCIGQLVCFTAILVIFHRGSDVLNSAWFHFFLQAPSDPVQSGSSKTETPVVVVDQNLVAELWGHPLEKS